MTYPHKYTKVSIITPALNSIKTIEQTIQSVLDQNYPNLEHIVVDGGSTDGTLELLKCTPHLRWISEPDEGQSDALNKGFSLADGGILGWLNADDTYNPGAVKSAVAFLDEHPLVGMVYSNCNHIDERGQVLFHQRVSPFDLAHQLIDFQIPQPTVFFRKEMMQQVGKLDTRLHYVMDWVWFLRLGVRYPIGYVDETWANFRVWGDTKTSQHPEKFWQEIISFFDVFFQFSGLPSEVEAVRHLAYARAYWVLGCIYYSLLIRRGIEVGERGSLLKSLENFPLLKLDRNFAIDQIVHWGVSQLEMTQVDDYVMRLFEELSIFDPKVGRLKRQVLGHIYASSFLTRNKRTPTAREDSKRYLKWIGMAIMYDPSWLFNRGMQAGIFQLIRRKKA